MRIMLNINNKAKQAASGSWGKHPTDSEKAVGESTLRNADPAIFWSEPPKLRKKAKKTLSEVEVGQEITVSAHNARRIPSNSPASSVWMNNTPEPVTEGRGFRLSYGVTDIARYFYLGGKLKVLVVSAERNKRDRRMDCRGTVLSHERDGWMKSIRNKDSAEYSEAVKRLLGKEIAFKI